MRKAVACLQSAIEGAEQRTRKRRTDDAKRFYLACEVLLCNLLALSIAAPGARLQVYLERHSLKHSRALGTQHALSVKAMQQLGLLELRPNERNRLGSDIRTLSSVLPTAALKSFLYGLNIEDVRLLRNTSAPLVLRGFKDAAGNAPQLEWTHTSETRLMSERMREVNDFMHSLDVTYTGKQAWLAKTSKPTAWLRHIVTPQHTRSVRIFNDCSFAFGGRLNFGWWVQFGKVEREQHIKLQGEPVVHCDYSSMYLHLAYHHYGIAWPFADGVNGYVPDVDYGDPQSWKEVTSAMLASKRVIEQFPGKTQDERNAMQRCFHDMPARDVYAAVRARHPALTDAGAFGCGLSNQLARQESDLIVELLRRLQAVDVHVLPVHDCIVTPASKAAFVLDLMQSTATEFLGVHLPVKLDVAERPYAVV